MSNLPITQFHIPDPKQSEGYKLATRLKDSIQEYVTEMDIIRGKQIKSELTKFKSDFREKQLEFEAYLRGFSSTDARLQYLLARLHHFEQQMQAEKLGVRLESILAGAKGNEDQIAKEVCRISAPFPQIIAYFMNRAMFGWLTLFKNSMLASQASGSALEIRHKAAATTNQLPAAEGASQVTTIAAPVALPKTKEDILSAMQGLPPKQQLLTWREVLIVLGIKKSTFFELRKGGDFPSPVRINGKGRQTYYLLEEVLLTLTTSRQKSKFKPKW